MMKGISLAIETVIIFIIAAAVLAILLYFFLSVANPSISIIQLKGEQARLCSSYVTNDPDCNDPTDVEETIKNSLAETCRNLNAVEAGYDSCGATFSIDCVKQCCKSFCPSE